MSQNLNTTKFAREQEHRLIKTLGRFDIIFFIIAAYISLDTIGSIAAGGSCNHFYAPKCFNDGRNGVGISRRRWPIPMGEICIRSLRCCNCFGFILDYKSTLARWLALFYCFRYFQCLCTQGERRSCW